MEQISYIEATNAGVDESHLQSGATDKHEIQVSAGRREIKRGNLEPPSDVEVCFQQGLV